MKSFEYKVMEVEARGFWNNKVKASDIEKMLNQLGADGWELVSTFDQNWYQGGTKNAVLILKRPVL
jgi:hypothetical protein